MFAYSVFVYPDGDRDAVVWRNGRLSPRLTHYLYRDMGDFMLVRRRMASVDAGPQIVSGASGGHAAAAGSVLISSAMTGTIRRKVSTAPSLASALGLVLAAGWLLAACGGVDSQAGADQGGVPTAEQPSPPPIDLAAPESFRTASFAFG